MSADITPIGAILAFVHARELPKDWAKCADEIRSAPSSNLRMYVTRELVKVNGPAGSANENLIGANFKLVDARNPRVAQSFT